ncbi:uncharacterized protein BXZ73DRAFT_36674, partial [Epithele typhae]|uniref:uncharacterized protein n=1 Tax=Epithele typhae TaxID=378194 RepID=UPI0020088D76
NDLTEEDLEILRPFALKVETNMTLDAFSRLPFAFKNSNFRSWKETQAHVARLSGFQPQIYHCCINSCCAFTGLYEEKITCPYCKSNRYNLHGKPRKLFIYLPITPRLKAYLSRADTAMKMRHRAQAQAAHNPDIVKDVTDSTNYHGLLTNNVEVNGRSLPYKFFEDPHDFALSLSTDGFAPFKRRSK